MVLGARPIGTRTLGDSAPVDALGDAGAAGATEGVGTVALGALTVTGAGKITRNASATVAFGTLFVGTDADPGGGTGGDGAASGGGSTITKLYRPMSLPFEYDLRFRDAYDKLGFTYDQAVWLEERDRQLEDFLADFMPDLVFTFPGLVSESTSPRYRARFNYRVDTWLASLNTAGSTDTVLKVLVDGNETATITIASGQTEGSASRYCLLTKDESYVQVQVSTVGTGAEDLTVQGLLRR